MKNIKDKTKNDKMPLAGKMICPQCNMLGKTSNIFEEKTIKAVPQHMFWDEEGRYHNHAELWELYFRCSRDHLLKYMYIRPPDVTKYCGTCNPSQTFSFGIALGESDEGEEWKTPKEPEPTFYLQYIEEVDKSEESQ